MRDPRATRSRHAGRTSAARPTPRTPHPLAAFIFSRDQKTIDRFVSELSYGGGAVNQVNIHLYIETMPFGGVGPAGMGHYYGKNGFDTLTHAKPPAFVSPEFFSGRRLSISEDKRCNYYRRIVACMLSGASRDRPVIVGGSTANRPHLSGPITRTQFLRKLPDPMRSPNKNQGIIMA